MVGVSGHENEESKFESKEGHHQQAQTAKRVDQEVDCVGDQEEHHVVAEVLEVYHRQHGHRNVAEGSSSGVIDVARDFKSAVADTR